MYNIGIEKEIAGKIWRRVSLRFENIDAASWEGRKKIYETASLFEVYKIKYVHNRIKLSILYGVDSGEPSVLSVRCSSTQVRCRLP